MKYKVWRVVNFPNDATYYEVDTPLDGAMKIIELAKMDLKNPHIETNTFGLIAVTEYGEEEWYDENGNDIDVMVDEMWDEVDI